MYGYIRPLKPELKLREYEQFRSAYCGLCHALKRRYGALARFAVSYDMTFLAMLLSPRLCTAKHFCPRHPLRRVSCLCAAPALDRTADITILLAYQKLEDDAADRLFPAKLPALIAKRLLHGYYRRAERYLPGFTETSRRCLEELHRLENGQCDSLDQTADCFARLLAACAEETEEESSRRIQSEILYHAGRIVYILDAADDLREDIQKGSFNPLRSRAADSALPPAEKESLRITLNLSQHRMASALELRGDDPWRGILENIIWLGIPAAVSSVLSGTWNAGKHRNLNRKEETE